ncbi:MAG: YggS family pyridoxal phosphate-dependent enzyme [Alteromonadaceae bacterium]|jgi:pyridoxal phosphate enzyme (YggS family)|uniref:Pyridoxal phosphate homeostasis protein n=1 Tax=Paraglaciecola chathamensis TaxID=368405 RepID=A0A8H9I731_9ALTE|nr:MULTISPECIES: YggS family pyridoxal phosphate-dependent enzyme [Paraglaciecola]MBJ2137239.1 YggS family pyridoxal phosphate-dependent enzyme [Paraglaciecola chathamensis]MBN26037.1 YggS family pyridoxal phosphate-dependent enzyme [Alteromonadaceae bacterium]GGZ49390.1 YggS family pyridoxal phosphate enzyme [Paraglaciecola oceanifecundans]|tara:strand:- start:57478 stop:58161 length:684 start_codon:yes stop_codon:yes gene_type:complete
MGTIAERLKIALKTITQSVCEANRPANSVKLLAVTKTKPVSDIVQAYEAGHRLFGENYVQEGVDKIQQLSELDDIEWHFIGPLQSNKTRPVAENFDWVHSIDRLKIAQRLNDQRSAHKKLNVCIQVNIDNEASKAGVPPEDVNLLAEQISNMPNLTLRGLMTIPKAQQNAEMQRKSLSAMNALFVQLQTKYPQIDTLSMGMSNDMQLAIECGSTMVRIGSAIFGSRQ